MRRTATHFAGMMAFRYYSQFKPTEVIELCDGAAIVPAGWTYLPTGTLAPGGVIGQGSYRVNVSYFRPAEGSSAHDAQAQFRKWIAFDSVALMTDGAIYFDRGMCSFEPIAHQCESGTAGDEQDSYNAIDYDDISLLLVRALRPVYGLPSHSYADLYRLYLHLSKPKQELVEWVISGPVSPQFRPPDAFSRPYWQLIHAMITIERCIGLPPKCECDLGPCPRCGAQVPGHASISRRSWSESRLSQLLGTDTDQIRYAQTLIQAGLGVRNKLSHGPHFDRSNHLGPQDHGHVESYDADRAASDYQHDSTALFALVFGLNELAHQLVVAEAFGIQVFPKMRPLKAITTTRSGRVI